VRDLSRGAAPALDGVARRAAERGAVVSPWRRHDRATADAWLAGGFPPGM
jgi:hypothetical protein